MTICISQPHPIIKLQCVDSTPPLHPSASLRTGVERGGGDVVFRSDEWGEVEQTHMKFIWLLHAASY
jgi:hypothetical protein